MADLGERIDAEFENIERVVSELPASNSYSRLSAIELAGVGALIQNFYNGIENILKQILTSRGTKLSASSSWHRDLVNLATSSSIISELTAKNLRPYLAFRHFFAHGYSFDLDKERIIPLVEGMLRTLASFRDDISKALKQS